MRGRVRPTARREQVTQSHAGRCALTPGHIVAVHRVAPRVNTRSRARELNVEATLRDLAVLATIALLFAAVLQVMLLARHRRELEAELGQVHAELETLRERLDEATRPPTQFARMRLRERAVNRFGRLRRAVPRRSRIREASESLRDLSV